MFLAHIGRIAAPRIAAFPSLFYCSYTILHRQPVMPISQGRDRERKPALRGVVFDMDGTLTVPVIDFSAMYLSVLGEEGYAAAKSSRHGGSVDILHCIETWTPQEQQRAYEIISHFERQGLDRLQIMPGAAELCGHLDSKEAKDANKGAKPQNRLMGEVRTTKFDGTIWCTCRYDLFGVFERGLITRNVKAAVDLFHQRFGLIFVPALSREFRPYKPDPAPLLHICSSWGVPPNEVMMIGDSLRDDVTCGKRAGSFTCLLDETGRYGPLDSLSEDVKPDFKVSSLAEVQSLLEKFFELLPHPQANEQNN